MCQKGSWSQHACKTCLDLSWVIAAKELPLNVCELRKKTRHLVFQHIFPSFSHVSLQFLSSRCLNELPEPSSLVGHSLSASTRAHRRPRVFIYTTISIKKLNQNHKSFRANKSHWNSTVTLMWALFWSTKDGYLIHQVFWEKICPTCNFSSSISTAGRGYLSEAPYVNAMWRDMQRYLKMFEM